MILAFTSECSCLFPWRPTSYCIKRHLPPDFLCHTCAEVLKKAVSENAIIVCSASTLQHKFICVLLMHVSLYSQLFWTGAADDMSYDVMWAFHSTDQQARQFAYGVYVDDTAWNKLTHQQSRSRSSSVKRWRSSTCDATICLHLGV